MASSTLGSCNKQVVFSELKVNDFYSLQEELWLEHQDKGAFLQNLVHFFQAQL